MWYPSARFAATLSVCVGTLALGACRGGGSPAGSQTVIPATNAVRSAPLAAGRLGSVLNTQDGGQVFGFDINQNGADGALASSRSTNKPGIYTVSVETFNQDTGAITSSFAKETGRTNSYAFDGIFAGDTGLVTHYTTPKGTIYATRSYELMGPVTAQKFTGPWSQPTPDIDILQAGVNQTTPTAVLFAIELKNADVPDLIVSDVAHNTISNVIHLDPNLFGGANGPMLGQFVRANEAVIALSPDAGAVGAPGAAPLNIVFNLATGAKTQFKGFNNGFYGSGYVNGLAVDPNTGVAATTTELNAQVEFYDIAKRKGIVAAQLPCTSDTSQSFSAAGVAADPVHKLFLVSAPFYACGSGSALIVYDEAGKLVETITGFTFALAEPAAVLNPSKRMGWTFGPKFSQLQQFFY